MKFILDVNYNFILPKVNTDYVRQAQVMNIDNFKTQEIMTFNQYILSVGAPPLDPLVAKAQTVVRAPD